MRRVSAILFGIVLALSVHASGILAVLLANIGTAPSAAIHFIQAVPTWSATTPATSGSFIPQAGDVILVYGSDYTNVGPTISISGTGTYSVINPPGQFTDVENDATALAENAAASGGAQTITITSTHSGDTTVGIAAEYSNVAAVTAKENSQTTPGSGAGAVVGVSVTVPTGDVLLAFAIDLDGGGVTASTGTQREIGTSYVVADYAGAGSAIQPTFTGANGATDNYVVVQYLLAPSGPVTAYKWHPGYYGLTYNQPIPSGSTYSGSSTQTDVNAVIAASPTVKGYEVWFYWAGLESGTLGNYTFSGCTTLTTTSRSSCATGNMLDDMLNALWAGGERAIIMIQDTGSFSGGSTPPTAGVNGGLPAYITATANTGTYGSGLTGCGMSNPSGAGGFWANQSGSYSANIENANVQNREIALATQLATKYDNDPEVEGIFFTAMDFHAPCSTLGLGGAAYYNAWKTILGGALSAFSHTNVGIMVAFDQGGAPAVEDFTTWLVQNKGMISESDTYGASAWTPTVPMGFCSTGSGYWVSPPPSGTSGTMTGTWSCNASPATYSGGNLYFNLKGLSSGATLNSVSVASGSSSLSWLSITGTGTGSDVYDLMPPMPITQGTQGIQAYLGIVPNGSGYSLPGTALQSLSTSWVQIQAGDICSSITGPDGAPYTAADEITALNLTGINGYNASHPAFTILYSGDCGDAGTAWEWAASGGVVSQMAATPLTNVGYPSVYH